MPASVVLWFFLRPPNVCLRPRRPAPRCTQPQVLIIGAQFAGRRVARDVQGVCNPILVDDKDFWEYTPSALRCLVQPQHARYTLLPHALTGKEAVLVTRCSSITCNADNGEGGTSAGGHVHCTDGSELRFDFCVICTGSGYISPVKAMHIEATMAQRWAGLDAAAFALAAASSVLIIGGGYVGVELAAEVAGRYGRRKQVTVITAADRLLDRMPPKAGLYAGRWLVRNGVQLLHGERVTSEIPPAAGVELGDYEVQTSRPGGRTLKAQLVYMCAGSAPRAAIPVNVAHGAVGASKAPAAATELQGKGEAVTQLGVPVLPTLQVEGYPCVFACGDCAAMPFERNAYLADLSASLAAANIKRAVAGRQLLRFPEDVCHGRRRPPTVCVVSLYKYDGIMQLNGLVLTGWLAAQVKVVIEWFQILDARGVWLAGLVWGWCEAVMTFLACTCIP